MPARKFVITVLMVLGAAVILGALRGDFLEHALNFFGSNLFLVCACALGMALEFRHR